MLKVFALQADNQACGVYRIEQPALHATQADVDTVIDHDLPADALLNRDGSIIVERVNVDADVIIFQRPLSRAFVPAILRAQKQGIACVVELDDDLSSVERDNLAHDAVDPHVNPSANWKHLAEAAKIADWVTVSSDALAERYGKHGRVSVIRNALPKKIFDIEKTFPETPRVGWTGSLATHPHDLEVAGSHIGTVIRTTGAEFAMLGDPAGVIQQLGITEDTNISITEWVDLDKYHETLANSMDIGIVPLIQNYFNASKSWLKGLEMAGVGIPFVASQTHEYELLAALGAGRIARKRVDWQKHLRRFISDRDYMLEESARVRQAVSTLTYDNAVEQWVDAWVSACEHRASVNRTGGKHPEKTSS